MGHLARPESEPTTGTESYARAFPVELVLHFIRLSLPSSPAPSNDFAERSAALRSYALVSPTWRDLAQRELFARPTVRAGWHIASFLDTLKARPALRAVVRGIALGRCRRAAHNTREDAVGIEEVLATCTAVEEVHLYGLSNVRLSWLVVLKGQSPLHSLCLVATIGRQWMTSADATLRFGRATTALQKLILSDIGLRSATEDRSGVTFTFPLLHHLSSSGVSSGYPRPAEGPTLVLPALRVLSLSKSRFVHKLSGLSPLLFEAGSLDLYSPTPQQLELPAGVPVLWAPPVGIVSQADLDEHNARRDVDYAYLRCTFAYSEAMWRNRNREHLRKLAAKLKSDEVPALRWLRSLYLQAYFNGDGEIDELLDVCRERAIAVIYKGMHPSVCRIRRSWRSSQGRGARK